MTELQLNFMEEAALHLRTRIRSSEVSTATFRIQAIQTMIEQDGDWQGKTIQLSASISKNSSPDTRDVLRVATQQTILNPNQRYS
jgi:hypothetical protein